MPNVLRTLRPPRFRDSWSFSGLGRWLYQYENRASDPNGQPNPDSPPREGAPVGPGEPRG